MTKQANIDLDLFIQKQLLGPEKPGRLYRQQQRLHQLRELFQGPKTKNIAQAIGSMKVLQSDTSYKGDRRHEELAEPGNVDRLFPEGTTRTDILFKKKFINRLRNALKIGPTTPTKEVDTGMPMISPYHTPQGVQGWI